MDCHTCRDNVNIITLLNNQLCFVFVSGGTGHCMSSFRPKLSQLFQNCFNPFPSLPSVATNDSLLKQFQMM